MHDHFCYFSPRFKRCTISSIISYKCVAICLTYIASFMIVEPAIANDYIYQPVPNNITSQQLHKPIPYGYATFGLEKIPVMVIPVKTYTTKAETYYAPPTLKRRYNFFITKLQSKILALYVAGETGYFIGSRGLEIVGGPIDGEDSSAGFTLESPDGKYWVAYRTDGDCAGCSMDSAFDWFPWDHSPFSAGEKKAKEKYKMRYQKITEHFTLFSYNHNGREIYSLTNYSNDEFKQLFFSFQNYPTQDTAIINFNENNLLRIRK